MLPTVAIILNKRFIPPTPDGPFPVGASHFSLLAAKALSEASCLAGFLLYQRKNDLIKPAISPSQVFEYPACDTNLAFTLRQDLLRLSLKDALDQLLAVTPASSKGEIHSVLYHQTGVLVPFAPHSVKNIVTHHGPFVSDVVKVVGKNWAEEAFGGGGEKIVELQRAQEAGIERLRIDRNSYAFEFSSVQVSSLLERGIPQDRILTTVPPIILDEAAIERESIPIEVNEFLGRITSDLLLVSAVARLDAFKNIGPLITAAVQLNKEGSKVAVLIVGDTYGSLESRVALERLIPNSQRGSFLFVPSLPRNQMLKVFSRVKDKGVFALTSVFETFGFTPLEAMCCGLTTIVPDRARWLGIAAYVPKELRYEPGPEGLLQMLRTFLENRHRLEAGRGIANSVRRQVGYERFKEDLLKALQTVKVRSQAPRPARDVRAVIFDLDNCLADPQEAGDHLLAPVFDAMRRANHGSISEEAMERALSECWRHPLDVVAKKHGLSNEITAAGWQIFSQIEIEGPLRGYPDIGVLAEFTAKRFLVTSGFRKLQESKVRALGIDQLFTSIHIDAIDEATRPGKQKIFEDILDNQGLRPEEVLVVGDDPDSEIEIGNRLGIRTVQILRPGVEFNHKATHHIQHLDDLRELVC